jgi:multiple sugar transport system permease protein
MSIAGQRRRWWTHAVLIGTATIVLVPVIWVVMAGFRTQISLLMGEIMFRPVWTNFVEVLFSKTSDFLANYQNSIIVASASTILCVTAATLAAWSLFRMRWPRWITLVFLAWTMIFHLIPSLAIASGWYTLARATGLHNTLLGVILGHAVLNLPMSLWLMTVFINDVPRELEEAARIDGANTPELLRTIVLPIIAPGLAATSVLAFLFSWNEFAVALTLTSKQSATVPVAIAKFAQEFNIQYTQMAAAATLSVIPALLVLLFAQRYIVRGLTNGAVK